MMNKKKPIRFLRLAALFSVLACAIQASATEVTIGWAGPATQKHALAFRQSAQLAIDEANQRGIMLGGEKLHFNLSVIDDKDSPNFAAIAAQSFVTNKVSAVIGHYSSDPSLAALPIYSAAQIPMITGYSGSPKLTQLGYRNVFQLVGNAAEAINYIADSLIQKPDSRVAVAHSKTAIATAFADALDQAMHKRGSKLTERIAISGATSDFNEILAILEREKIDSFYFAALQFQALALSKRLEQIKTHSRIVLSGGLFNANFFNGADDYPEGTQILMHAKPEKQLPGFAKFEKAYLAKFGPPLMPYAVNAYDAVNMVIQAIQTGGSTAPQQITDTLHKISFNGVTGKIAFDPTGQLISPSFTLYQVEHKKWKPIRVYP